jgi:hypothetical protein
MNCKKTIFVVGLAGMMVIAVAGCGQAEEATPAIEQPSPAVEQTIPTPESTIPLLADEGTMPTSPKGVTPGERPLAPAMDLATAAEKLGVTEQQLIEALGEQQGLPDMAAAAEKLGVSEELLREALGFLEGSPTTGGLTPSGSPPEGKPSTGPEPTGQGQ